MARKELHALLDQGVKSARLEGCTIRWFIAGDADVVPFSFECGRPSQSPEKDKIVKG